MHIRLAVFKRLIADKTYGGWTKPFETAYGELFQRESHWAEGRALI